MADQDSITPKLTRDNSFDELIARLRAHAAAKPELAEKYTAAVNILVASEYTGTEALGNFADAGWKTTNTLQEHGASRGIISLIYEHVQHSEHKEEKASEPLPELSRQTSIADFFKIVAASESPTLQGFPRKTIQGLLAKPDNIPRGLTDVSFLLDHELTARHKLGMAPGFSAKRVQQLYNFLAEAGLTPGMNEQVSTYSGELTRQSNHLALAAAAEKEAQAFAEGSSQHILYDRLANRLQYEGLPAEHGMGSAGALLDDPQQAKRLLRNGNWRYSEKHWKARPYSDELIEALYGIMAKHGLEAAAPQSNKLKPDSSMQELVAALREEATQCGSLEHVKRKMLTGLADKLEKHPPLKRKVNKITGPGFSREEYDMVPYSPYDLLDDHSVRSFVRSRDDREFKYFRPGNLEFTPSEARHLIDFLVQDQGLSVPEYVRQR